MARKSTKKPTGPKPKPKQQPTVLPVTLLSGFLGSGKTSLIQHILKTEHGLCIAVIVNDIGAINVDASLISQTHRLTQSEEKVVSLQNGCICCTLRGDLLEELVRLSELQQFDYVIVESSGISEPEQVAETFDSRLADTMAMIADGPDGLDPGVANALKIIKDAGGLDRFAKLDTTVTVIDAFTIFHDFDTDDMLSSRRNDVMPEDERTVSDLMVDQIEFADVIVLNKVDMINAKTRKRVLQLIKKLNHRAKIIETNFGKIEVREILNTGMFNLERAQTGYGWLQDLHAMTMRQVNGKNVMTPKPETEEYDVRNFVYCRRRPFHPRRLFTLLFDKFILQMEHPDDDEDEDEDKMETDEGDEDEDEDEEMDGEDKTDAIDEIPGNDIILANKRASPLFRRLFRSKGEFFLATRAQRAGEWSQAGAMLTLTGGRPWFCTLPAEEYVTGNEEIDRLVRHDMATGGEWGDRRQEIVFIGEALDVKGLEKAFDACLLRDDEFAQWEAVMRNRVFTDDERKRALEDLFEDGFPDWADNDVALEHEGHNHAM